MTTAQAAQHAGDRLLAQGFVCVARADVMMALCDRLEDADIDFGVRNRRGSWWFTL